VGSYEARAPKGVPENLKGTHLQGNLHLHKQLLFFLSFMGLWESIKIHIVKDVVVIFHEAFSHDRTIHPSVPSSIHGWHHIGKKTLAEINNPPLCACVAV
jgi:hypothetical protein